MLNLNLSASSRWLPIALLLVVSCAGAAPGAQELATGPDRTGWPKEFEARDSRIVVYEPQLETFRGNKMTARSAVSVLRPDTTEPVFGAIWLDSTLITDPERKTVTPLIVRITEVRFPALGTDEAARLRQDIGDEIPRWDLKYSVDDLLAELRLLEQQKATADGLKADVPRIFFRNAPAVLLAIQDEPAWRKSADPYYERLENSAAFVLRNAESGTCYLRFSPLWWTSTDPLGAWKAADTVPDGVTALWNKEPRPQIPAEDPAPESLRRPEVIPATGAAELVWTDGAPQYAPIAGTNLLYIRNTESDVFLDTLTQLTYALFSGRWYRTPASKDAWEFVASDQLPFDFSYIPIDSEKRHVLACVAGNPQARDAARNAEIPVTEAIKPGPAPELQATYDGEPQFQDIPEAGVQYAVNTPYSVFCADRRYYWCFDGIWYDSDFAVGPWFVCIRVPSPIYLIPPSCPHYYVTYCHIFNVSPLSVCVGYYPGYCGSYVWHGCVVYGTGWHYRPWIGSHCYPRPVTWGLSVHYNPVHCGWSMHANVVGSSVGGLRHGSVGRAPVLHAGAGGYWGGTPGHSNGAATYRRGPSGPTASPAPPQNLYDRQPDRRAPARPAERAPLPSVRRDPGPVAPGRPPEREPERTPPPPRDHREIPRTPPPVDREIPRTPPPDRETPKPPPQREPREVPPPRRENPPPPQPRHENPPPPPQEAPRRPPPQREPREVPPPRRENPPPQEAPRRAPPPPEHHEAPRNPPPPPQHRQEQQEQKSPPPPSERRR
jgi:hypothetical protein